ncbi:hypothetical protein HRD49_10260 [Corallococcus exiguus]|uniref:Uncharacterized protein n=1 Tax=Corallococcus exiguus TaxID=83462 RepID=A0A7Y1S1L9_9BACT|nr:MULTISPECIES: hypothetical protein [Corallococcus]NBC38676.1 hypothetical protein [Corallococcus exiguus]NNC15929.1 hypothetical protein [Corallococcus exiguus]NRD52157.1 hypothetical protein [Corallococcus exiguus]NRD62134.1 hypothetical protein [Corallococcus exiguus]RKI19991.1 hypothetical protein D7Y15_02600 [Corallococcus sp. AB030]
MLKTAGYFREFGPGFEDAPSLVESRGKLPEEDWRRVARYLHTGVTLAVSGGLLKDCLTGETLVASHYAQTDGVWTWRADLPRYVERYRVAIPDAFLEHMRALDWKCPVLSQQELIALTERLFHEMKHARKHRRKP